MADVSGERLSDSVAFPSGQVGKKFGKHCRVWGLDPSSEEDRQRLKGTIKGIIDGADEVDEGDWRGQPNPRTFYLRGNDLVIVNALGEFVTVMKGGGDNRRYRSSIGRPGD